MKVYLCIEVYYNYCDEFQYVVKVVDDEVKALVWKEDFTPTDTEWRNYTEYDLE